MDDLILETANACTPATAQADRVKISAFQWRAAKLKPKVYGDKAEVAMTGLNGGPVQSERVIIPVNDPIGYYSPPSLSAICQGGSSTGFPARALLMAWRAARPCRRPVAMTEAAAA